MRGHLFETDAAAPLAALLSSSTPEGVRFYWLGQAGFVLEIAGRRIVIDPYLSDSLAEKYRGTPRPHNRMMPPPIAPGDCLPVDLVLSTHAHTDHMDPGTLPILLSANPEAAFVAPRAMRQQAQDRSGLAGDRLVLINAAETIRPFPGLAITATRSAHEALERDANGNHRFLGYLFDDGETRIWHSGDCVPFDGLVKEVSAYRPDIAMLPVNGRKPELSQNGVPGNFSLWEAIDTAKAIGARHLVAHHYGLFEFNTEEPAVIDAAAATAQGVVVHRAQTGTCYEWHAVDPV